MARCDAIDICSTAKVLQLFNKIRHLHIAFYWFVLFCQWCRILQTILNVILPTNSSKTYNLFPQHHVLHRKIVKYFPIIPVISPHASNYILTLVLPIFNTRISSSSYIQFLIMTIIFVLLCVFICLTFLYQKCSAFRNGQLFFAFYRDLLENTSSLI